MEKLFVAINSSDESDASKQQISLLDASNEGPVATHRVTSSEGPMATHRVTSSEGPVATHRVTSSEGPVAMHRVAVTWCAFIHRSEFQQLMKDQLPRILCFLESKDILKILNWEPKEILFDQALGKLQNVSLVNKTKTE